MRASIVSCLTLVLLSACGTPSTAPGAKSDWEKAHEEKLAATEKAAAADSIPPPPTKRGELIEFSVPGTRDFRFFVDASTLSIDSEGIVRYVLVARSTSGTENVSFEGMRCVTHEYRIYALGRDGAWVGRPTDWRTMDVKTVTRWHHELARNYFCPQREPITNAREGVVALRQGGHPMTKGLGLVPQFGGRY
jgi:hypothetical protein